MLVSPCRFARRFRVLKHLESWPLRSKKNRKKNRSEQVLKVAEGAHFSPYTEKRKASILASGSNFDFHLFASNLCFGGIISTKTVTFWGHFFVAWMTLISLISLLGVGVLASGLAVAEITYRPSQVAPKGPGSGGAGAPHLAICIAEWKGQPARCQALIGGKKKPVFFFSWRIASRHCRPLYMICLYIHINKIYMYIYIHIFF